MSYLSKIFNVVAGTGLLILGYNHYRTNQKLKRLRKSNSEKNRITSELRLASQIQQSMMPLGPVRWVVTCSTTWFVTGSSTSVLVTSAAREPPPPCLWPMHTRCYGLSRATRAIQHASYNLSTKSQARIMSLVRSSPSSTVCSTCRLVFCNTVMQLTIHHIYSVISSRCLIVIPTSPLVRHAESWQHYLPLHRRAY